MAKFIIINSDSQEIEGDSQDTYEKATVAAQEMAEATPDVDFYVAEIKAKIMAELRIEIIVDEKQFNIPAK